MRKIEGKKIGKDGAHPAMLESKGDIIYPSMYFDVENLPEAKKWEIGKTYDVTVRIRMTGINIRKHEGKDKDMGDASFELIGIEPHGKAMSDEEKATRRRVKDLT